MVANLIVLLLLTSNKHFFSLFSHRAWRVYNLRRKANVGGGTREERVYPEQVAAAHRVDITKVKGLVEHLVYSFICV